MGGFMEVVLHLLRGKSILRDKAPQKITEMVNDADFDDPKFQAPGADGIDRVLRGLCHLGWTDEKILQHGFVCFAALYAQVRF